MKFGKTEGAHGKNGSDSGRAYAKHCDATGSPDPFAFSVFFLRMATLEAHNNKTRKNFQKNFVPSNAARQKLYCNVIKMIPNFWLERPFNWVAEPNHTNYVQVNWGTAISR